MVFHTFVICAYKESPYIEKCIRSLKAQTCPTQIICATSTPSAYLTGILERYQIPLYVRKGKSGIQEDWNFAFSKAEGQFVTIAHQDDMYNRHYVEELKKNYEKWPDMTVFMTDAVTVKNGELKKGGTMELVKKLLRTPLRFHSLCHLAAIKKSALIFGNPVMCPSCAYRKDKMDEPMFHSGYEFVLDWDCMTELADKEGRFICVEKPLLYYRVHEGAATKACIENHRREWEERLMFERFWPKTVVDIMMYFYKSAYKEYNV